MVTAIPDWQRETGRRTGGFETQSKQRVLRNASRFYSHCAVAHSRRVEYRLTVNPRLGYLFERFPAFTKTFCAREVAELYRQGVSPSVFSIRRPMEGRQLNNEGGVGEPVRLNLWNFGGQEIYPRGPIRCFFRAKPFF